MLIPAILREQDLRLRFVQRLLEPESRFYYFQTFADYELTVDRNDWKRIQVTSVSREGELLGYFEARLNRESMIVEDLLILRLHSAVLPREASEDLFRFLAYLLDQRGFRKIFFRYVRDNPAGQQYEKFFLKSARCGSIQGILEDYVTLTDGKVYDLVIMDIKKDPYLKWFEGRHALHSPN